MANQTPKSSPLFPEGLSTMPPGYPDPDVNVQATVPTQLLAAERVDDDGEDEAFEDDVATYTVSISSSILNYRAISGRTYHSDRYDLQHCWAPNDDRQSNNVDITHHYMTLLLDGKLHLAPVGHDVQKVLDIGTGTGIWAIDFGDEYPSAEVIGTDLSPMMPNWVPPNVRFEIEDATKPWTFSDESFDFVHIRFMTGSINDWDHLFREAYRVLKPGGWVHSGEFDPRFHPNDETAEKEAAAKAWNRVFEEGGKKIGNSFTVVEDNTQELGIKAAGFEEVKKVMYKAPVGSWAADKKLAEVGNYVRLSLESDMEGYTLLLCTEILGWSKEEHQIFLMNTRKMVRNSLRLHFYFDSCYVWGRKRESKA